MKIGVDTESLHLWLQNKKIDIYGFIDLAVQMGFDGVMINLIAKKNQTEGLGALGRNDPAHIRKVGAYIRERGMFVELAARGTEYEHLRELLTVAKLVGAKTIRTFVMSGGGYSTGNLGGTFEQERFFQAGEDLKRIVPLLEEYDIQLAIENHELETGQEIRRLVEAVDSPRVGVLFDVGNPMMAWEEPQEALEEILPYLKSTHIKDHIVCEHEGEPVVCGAALGEGNIDLEAIVGRICQEGSLEHLILEMCNPYASPFRRPAGTGGVFEVGTGTFARKEPPYPYDIVKPLDYYLYEGEYLEQMMEKQKADLQKSLETLRRICAEAEQERKENNEAGYR